MFKKVTKILFTGGGYCISFRADAASDAGTSFS